MVNVQDKRCGYPGCNKHPSYGVEGSKAKKFCFEHKKEGMVDVVSKRCGHPGCNKLPTYGVEGSNTVEFCAEHKKDGMVDIINKRCGYPGCNKHPAYGVEGSKTKEFCTEHRKEGMVDVVSNSEDGRGICYVCLARRGWGYERNHGWNEEEEIAGKNNDELSIMGLIFWADFMRRW
eukprot:g18643.t1